MTAIDLEKPPLFFANYEATEKVVVNQGGTYSGKTWAILDVLFLLGIQDAGSKITVVAESVPNLRRGAFKDAKDIRIDSDYYIQAYPKINESTRTFFCFNGSEIEFISVDNFEKAKGAKRDYLFVNEATGINFKIYEQLAIRTNKRIFLDYNPSSKFWVHTQIIENSSFSESYKLIISDHRNNPYLSQDKHDEIESIADENDFLVYGRGLTGIVRGTVFKKWGVIDDADFPSDYKRRWIGLDFGFKNDPTALVDVRLANGELWVKLLCYQRGLVNVNIKTYGSNTIEPSIEQELIDNNIPRTLEIIADSAEDKAITEIRRKGYNVIGVKKGGGSVASGIEILDRYHINVCKSSADLIDELTKYKWKTDKQTNEQINEPIDKYNHAIDAIRYVAMERLRNEETKGQFGFGIS